MEEILEFLFSNIVFVAVIIGGLISFFSRMTKGSQQQEEQKRRTQPGQRQQPGQSPPQRSSNQRQEKVDWRDLFKQIEMKATGESEKPKPNKIQEEQALLEKKKLEQQRYEQQLKRKQENISKQLETEDSHARKHVDLDLQHITGSEAVKGIVWAEVLGQPRSQRPRGMYGGRRY